MKAFKSVLWLFVLTLTLSPLTAINSLQMLSVDTSDYPTITGYIHVKETEAIIPSSSILDITLDKTFTTDDLSIKSMTDINKSVNLLICVDASGSMTAAQLRNIKAAIIEALQSIPNNTYYAIADFGNDFIIRSDFSNGGIQNF